MSQYQVSSSDEQFANKYGVVVWTGLFDSLSEAHEVITDNLGAYGDELVWESAESCTLPGRVKYTITPV